MKYIEFISNVWREQREPVGILTDDFVGKISKFGVWRLKMFL